MNYPLEEFSDDMMVMKSTKTSLAKPEGLSTVKKKVKLSP
jgi:hypothetical protein